jgi:CO/xanthine dehydrogenase FAD-binding subunit
VKPAPFLYTDPATVDEALSILTDLQEEATILAGGQSLVPLMNLRMATPSHIVDINRIDALSGIRSEAGRLVVGATTRHSEVAASPLLASAAPLVTQAARLIGHPQIRNRGTVGGSLAEADPAGHLPTVTLALGAEMIAASSRGTRRIPAGEFFIDFLTTGLQADELLLGVALPVQPDRSGSSFLEVVRRRGDFPIVSVAAMVQLDADGHVGDVAIALSCMGSTPLRATAAEDALRQDVPTPDAIREVASIASTIGDPVDNVHGTARYRRRAASVLVERALMQATQRARGVSS